MAEKALADEITKNPTEEKAPLELKTPKVSTDSDDEDEVPTSPLVKTPPSPEIEEDSHSLIKSLGGGLKVVIKNHTAAAMFLSDENNVGGYFHRASNQLMFMDNSKEFQEVFILYFTQGFRISEFKQKAKTGVVITECEDGTRDLSFCPRLFTLVVMQPLDESRLEGFPDPMAFQFDFVVNGMVTLIHNNLCICCKKRKETYICKDCGLARYCGKACQQVDWSLHKLLCKKAKKSKALHGKPKVNI